MYDGIYAVIVSLRTEARSSKLSNLKVECSNPLIQQEVFIESASLRRYGSSAPNHLFAAWFCPGCLHFGANKFFTLPETGRAEWLPDFYQRI